MWCPTCDKPTQVIDTRKYQDVSRNFDFVQRQRICRECKQRFQSIEIPQEVWERHYDPSLEAEQIEND